MALKIEIETKSKDLIVVKLEGRLDTETYLELENQITPIFTNPPKTVIFDMSDLIYISSMGLRTIFKARKAIEAKNGKLVMTNLQPQIAKIIEIANALPKTSIFQSVEEADRYFAAMQKAEIEKQQGSQG